MPILDLDAWGLDKIYSLAPINLILYIYFFIHSFCISFLYISSFLFCFNNKTYWVVQIVFTFLITTKMLITTNDFKSKTITPLQIDISDTSVTWSTTERREIRNFYYPSVFELTGRQRLTVKREIRNVGQLQPAVEGRKECRSISRGRSNKSRSEWKPTVVCTLWPERRRKRLNDWLES